MPIYRNRNHNRQSSNSNLADVLAFAGLAQDQQAQSDHANAQRVAQAMQMLGITNDQERAQAQSQHEAAMLAATQGNYQDEARQRQAATALAGRQADMANWEAIDRSTRGYEANANDLAHQKAVEQQGQDTSAMTLVEHMLGNPQIPTDTALGFLPASQQPNVDKMRATALQGRIGQATQAVAPIYQANAEHPEKIAAALKLIQPGWAAQPEVWNGIPWTQLNQGLPKTAATPPIASSAFTSVQPGTPEYDQHIKAMNALKMAGHLGYGLMDILASAGQSN